MTQSLHTISVEFLPVFDRLVFFHSRWMNSEAAQLFSGLFFIVSATLAFALFVYWVYCASRILASNGVELTDAEFDSLHWHKRAREQFLHAFLFGRLTLP